MSKLAGVLAVAVFTAGCVHYFPRRISMPQTEEASHCAANAQTDLEQCVIHQRGRRFCQKLYDDLLLRCPGAREEGAPSKSTADSDSTTQLPGYRP